MTNPEGLKYTETDEWVNIDDGLTIVGISDYAQEQLSDIVYVEFLDEEGDSVRKGDARGNQSFRSVAICGMCE